MRRSSVEVIAVCSSYSIMANRCRAASAAPGAAAAVVALRVPRLRDEQVRAQLLLLRCIQSHDGVSPARRSFGPMETSSCSAYLPSSRVRQSFACILAISLPPKQPRGGASTPAHSTSPQHWHGVSCDAVRRLLRMEGCFMRRRDYNYTRP